MTTMQEQVSVFLAGTQMDTVVKEMLPPFQGDIGRFRIASIAATWDQVRSQMASMTPEALVVEAAMAPGVDKLIEYCHNIGSLIVVVLPPAWAQAKGAVLEVPNVREVLVGPHVNYLEVADLVYNHVVSERALRLHAAPLEQMVGSVGGRGGRIPVGLRVFAFWASKGGTGKTTVALNFAYELSRRGVRTLLMGFDTPDDVGIYLGLNREPNSMSFYQHPSLDGFRDGIQTVDNLDVLLSPNDFYRAEEIAQRAADEDGSIKQLVLTAYQAGYAAVVMDLPPTETEWTLQPLLAANSLVFVAEPNFADQVKLVAAFKLLTETMAGQHRIPTDNMYVVLNGVSEHDNLTPDAFHQAAQNHLHRAFPPVIAALPWDPDVRVRGNQGQLACLDANGFGYGIRGLVDTFYQGISDNGSNNGQGTVLNLGFVKLRVK